MGTGATATEFAAIGRILADTAASHGSDVPAFRSPPRIPGVLRSVTRNRDKSVTVAVATRNRPIMAVVADMVDGVVLASGQAASECGPLHDSLWTAAQDWLLAVNDRRSNTATPSSRHLTVAA